MLRAGVAASVPPILLRVVVALALLTVSSLPWAAWPLAALLLLGAGTRIAAGLSLPVFTYALLSNPPGLLPALAEVVCIIGATRVLAVMGPGPASLDARRPRLDRLVARLVSARDTRLAVYGLRFSVALALLMGATALLVRGPLLAQALGVAWLVGGVLLVIGLLVPWVALYAALLLPLALPWGGGWPWLVLSVAALALALTDDDAVALDAWLARRGGLFPTVRREVVLEPTARVVRGAIREKP